MTGTARDVVERVLRAGRDGDIETFVALIANDGFIEWPHRPPGVPARVRGHAEIRRHAERHLPAAAGFLQVDDHRDVVVPLVEALAGRPA